MMPQGFKPLLAIESSKVKQQKFPMMLSEKLDGIRCIVFSGVAYSRSGKQIPNRFIQEYVFAYKEILEGVDGELIVGAKNAKDVFNATTSGVMSIEGQPDFTLWIFDTVSHKPFSDRYKDIPNGLPDRCAILPHFYVYAADEVDQYEAYFLGLGAEGVMLRDPMGSYKYGRSGTKKPELQKVKRFCTEEFEITGFEPRYINTNAPALNELGYTERSTSKEGLVATDELGAVILKTKNGKVFSCGSGLNDAARLHLWNIRDTLVGKLASVKYFDVGDYEVPRFPVLRGIRDIIDL